MVSHGSRTDLLRRCASSSSLEEARCFVRCFDANVGHRQDLFETDFRKSAEEVKDVQPSKDTIAPSL